jgi:NAD(P)H-dependent FMN reductase
MPATRRRAIVTSWAGPHQCRRRNEEEDAAMMTTPETGAPAREPVRFLVFSASMRTGSLNTRLAELTAAAIERNGGRVDRGTMREFDAPSFDQAVQDSTGIPPGAEAFCRRLEDNDAFVIVSPEYNASMPGALKNSIDWVSRYRPQPFNTRHGLLLSASPSMVGGNRGLWSLRVPLEHLGARVFPDMFSLAQAHEAFTADGRLKNEPLAERFERTVVAFMDLVEAAKHYPCAKKAWFEFLGETPEGVTARAE